MRKRATSQFVTPPWYAIETAVVGCELSLGDSHHER